MYALLYLDYNCFINIASFHNQIKNVEICKLIYYTEFYILNVENYDINWVYNVNVKFVVFVADSTE